MNKTTRDFLHYFPAVLIPALLSLIASAVFTRLFTPESYGIFSLAIAILNPLTIILTEWIAQPIVRYTAEYERRNTLDFLTSGVIILLAFLFIGLLLIIAVVWGLCLWLPFVSLDVALLLACSVTLIANSLVVILSAFVTAKRNTALYRQVSVLTALMYVVVPLVLISLFGNDVAFLIWGLAVGKIVSIPLLWRGNLSLRTFAAIQPRHYKYVRHSIKRIYHYGFPMMFWFLAAGILSAEDRYLIALFRSSDEVGIYGVNYGLIYGLSGLINAPVHMAIGPVLYRFWAEKQVIAAQAALKAMTNLYVILAFLMIGGIVVVGENLVTVLLGRDFREGATVLLPVLLGRIFWGMAHIGQKGLELHEKTGLMARLAFAAAGINLLLNLIFIPRWGYVAAAYTTTVSYFAYACGIYVAVKGLLPWRIDVHSVLQAALFCFLTISFCMFIMTLLPVSSIVMRLLMAGSLFTVMYSALFWFFGKTTLMASIKVGSGLE